MILWDSGYAVGYSNAAAFRDDRIVQLERKVKLLEAQLAEQEWAANVKLRDRDGAQLVTLGGYAYRWEGRPDLEVGEYVIIAAPFWDPRTIQVGQVSKLGSTWKEEHVPILRRAREDEIAQKAPPADELAGGA